MTALLDLDALGDPVEEPDTTATDRARIRLPARVDLDACGRLGELALWWAGVAGDERAPQAAVVLHVGASTALSAPRAAGAARPVALEAPDDVAGALAAGSAGADRAADEGVDLLVLTLAGGTSARVLAAELTGLDAVEAGGWPADRALTDEAWMDEVVAVRDGLRRTRGLRGRPSDLLVALGDAPLAAATALLVQSAARRTPTLLDGDGALVAALLARRCARSATAWWQVAGATDDPLTRRVLGSLDLPPLVDLGIAAQDGTAAAPALAVLDACAALLAAGPPDDGPDDGDG